MATLLDGKSVSAAVRAEVATAVQNLRTEGIVPCLKVILRAMTLRVRST